MTDDLILDADSLQHLLGDMAEKGILKERYSQKEKDLVYSLSLEGKNQAERLLKTERTARMFMVKLFMGMKREDESDSYAVIEAGMFFKKKFGINIFKDIVDAIKHNEVGGITIFDEKEFIKLYDKI